MFCSKNEGVEGIPGGWVDDRIQEGSHPAEYVNDGKQDTYWLSDIRNEKPVAVEIDLEDIYEVR